MPLSLTLYAKWTINSYTVTFNNNGGSGVSPSSESVNFGGLVTAPTSMPTYTGHTLSGWNTAADGNGTPWTFASTTMTAGDMTLYAQWSLNSYTVTYSAGTNGSLTGTTTQTVNYVANGTAVTAVADTGYHFVKWSDDVTNNPRTDNNITGAITVSAIFAINHTTITFNSNGGSVVTAISQDYGTTVSAPTVPTLTGYTFGGWYSDAGLTTPYTFGTMPASDTTLYVKWTINSYTVTYTAGASGSIIGTSPQAVNYGAAGTAVTAVPDTGYHFVNWSDSSTANPRTETGVTGNITVTANFAIDTHTLTYTAGTGGSITAPANSPTTHNYGDSITITALANTGYHFVNWTGDITTVASATTASTTVTMNGDYSITANFAINTYTLTYTAGAHGSITGTSPQAVNYGADGLAVTAVPATGYHFVNWSDASTANPRTDTGVTGDITVTANFAINTYTVTFDSNTGSGSMSNETENYNVATALTSNAFTRTGYTFAGWNTVAGGGGTSYADGASYPFTSSVTLYAQWTINSYTVTFDSNGGTAVTAITQNYGTLVSAPTAPTQTGYTFVGWYSDALLTTPYTFGTMPASNTTLYAKWAVNRYTVTYTAGANGSITGTSPQTVNYGAAGTVVTAVPDTGYHFVNWSDGSAANPRTDNNVTANMFITANFAANTTNWLLVGGSIAVMCILFLAFWWLIGLRKKRKKQKNDQR
jgi:uncharacterized repeat protein (TIGR02543 family)